MRCATEHSIFTCTNELGTAIIAVHVDDMPVTASSPSAMIAAKATLQKYFKIIDLRPVKWLLGICIERDCCNHTIALSQMAYIESIVTRFKIEDAFKVKTPMDTNVTLSKRLSPLSDKEKTRMENIPYLSAVGSLMYVSMATRPNITYAVSHLGKYFSNPGQAHWTAAQHVIHYLNGTCNQRLVLGGKQPIALHGHVDLDFPQDLDDRKSVSGYSFNLGSGAILWSSKKQATVAGSSMEAE